MTTILAIHITVKPVYAYFFIHPFHLLLNLYSHYVGVKIYESLCCRLLRAGMKLRAKAKKLMTKRRQSGIGHEALRSDYAAGAESGVSF